MGGLPPDIDEGKSLSVLFSRPIHKVHDCFGVFALKFAMFDSVCLTAVVV